MYECMGTGSWGRQHPLIGGNASAMAFASRSVRLPTIHQLAPMQSRYITRDDIHSGLASAAFRSSESPPTCALQFLLHARPRSPIGLTRDAPNAIRSRWVVSVPCQRDCVDRRVALPARLSRPHRRPTRTACVARIGASLEIAISLTGAFFEPGSGQGAIVYRGSRFFSCDQTTCARAAVFCWRLSGGLEW